VTWAVPELIDGSGNWREAFSFQSPAHNPVWPHPHELGLETGKPRIDRLAATEVRLRSAPNLDRMSPGRRGVVDQEGNLGILQHVSPLLGIAKVNPSDIDCVLLGIEPVGERNQMWPAVGADGCESTHCLALQVRDLGLGEDAHAGFADIPGPGDIGFLPLVLAMHQNVQRPAAARSNRGFCYPLPGKILTEMGFHMRAIRLYPPGQIYNLQLEEVEAPQPRPGHVLVRVHAAAITRGELEWPIDRLPAVPSHELSGVVVEDTDEFSAGEEVTALTPFDRDGVAADYAIVPAEVLGPKPRSLSHIQAAALPMPGLSAWQGLIVHGRLQPGERVGITGRHGGVGHIAAQLATSRGATLVEAGVPCDLLLDTAGGGALARAAGQAGRIVTIAEEAPGAHYFVVEPNREQLLELTRLVDMDEMRPEIDSVFPLAEARAAFTRSAARGKHGKVVLRLVE
jgi:NADPH:quinone reductase-like Zn-dependent oxidoreductase